MPGAPEPLRDLACVVHVHSTYSDGTASVEELIDATRASGRDVLMLTDHDSRGAARGGWEGRHGEVALVVGHEVSPRGGHLLVFGTEDEVGRRGRDEAAIVAAAHAAGGLTFAAHPFSTGSNMAERYRKGLGRPHAWPGLEHPGLDGIELWSLTTDVAEAWRSPGEAIAWMRDPERHLDGPPAYALAAWDELCRTRRVVAIGGLDAHQRGVRLPWGRIVSPMSNERYFRMLATYVQVPADTPPDFDTERAALFDALRAGRCYLGLDATAPARGFRFEARLDDGAVVPMGAEIEAEPCELRVELPHDGVIRLLRDGREIAGARGRRLTHRVDRPGVHRIEARRASHGRERTWILSNPIYLR